MLAVLAAILFAGAVLLHIVGGSGLFLSFDTFIGLGLMFVALHVAGLWPGLPWRRNA